MQLQEVKSGMQTKEQRRKERNIKNEGGEERKTEKKKKLKGKKAERLKMRPGQTATRELSQTADHEPEYADEIWLFQDLHSCFSCYGQQTA